VRVLVVSVEALRGWGLPADVEIALEGIYRAGRLIG